MIITLLAVPTRARKGKSGKAGKEEEEGSPPSGNGTELFSRSQVLVAESEKYTLGCVEH